MSWKDSKYDEGTLRRAQDAVNRKNAAVVAAGEGDAAVTKPQSRCICGVVVPGDDGNLECPEHFPKK